MYWLFTAVRVFSFLIPRGLNVRIYRRYDGFRRFICIAFHILIQKLRNRSGCTGIGRIKIVSENADTEDDNG